MERCQKRRVVYRGSILDLWVDEVALKDHRLSKREVVEHAPAVAVLAIRDDHKILLVRQFRYAVGKHMLELPAGLIDSGEKPLAAARRELREETGYTAKHLKLIKKIYSSPGFCREVVHLYLATGLKLVGTKMDPEEDIALLALSYRQCLKKLASSPNTVDAKTLLALALLPLLNIPGVSDQLNS
jgi:ADP-ribose pyrophosphatase